MTNPYSPPAAIGSIADDGSIARQRLAVPAVAMIVLSSLASVIWSIALVSEVVLVIGDGTIGGDALGFSAGITAGVFQFAALIVISIGAAQMRSLKSLRMARMSGILSCIPGVSPFFVLGIPFAVWSLILLRDAKIRSLFRS